jgi:hypothetical protein
MKNFVEIKAVRNYDIFKAGMVRCDCCKGYKECYEFIPSDRLHNFDNIFLCRPCATKCAFEIREGVLDELNVDKSGD